jgi:ribosomal protein S18 acetylase RimI-like enzyme
VHDVVHRRLKLLAYKLQLVQHIQPCDKPQRVNFETFMLEQLTADDSYLQKILFSDEATFHTHGVVNCHNCRIWGSKNPHAQMEHVRDSPKVNVWCDIMSGRIVGPFFFHESTITSAVYLDMLENFVFPQIAEVDGLIFQQDGAPPHFGAIVHTALDERFRSRWIGRGGPINWPPRSPGLTLMYFFFWGYIRNIVYGERVESLPDLRRRITVVIAAVCMDVLSRGVG